MPYIIAILALIVIGVGFTLFQSSDQTTDKEVVKHVTETSQNTELVAESTPTPETTLLEDTEYETEVAYEEEDNDDDLPAPLPVQTPPAVVAAVTPVVQAPTTETPVVNTVVTDYKDGTYTSHISYRTPDGTYAMDVTMTIDNDIVTNTTVAFDDKASKDGYTKKFNTSYQSYVNSQDLDTISPSRIAGASLTTDAFKKAIAEIKTKASV